MGIEPTPSAWKAEALPLSYARPVPNVTSGPVGRPLQQLFRRFWPGKEPKLWISDRPVNIIRHAPQSRILVGRGGFEPPKASPADLQSAPFDHSGTCPRGMRERVMSLSELAEGFEPTTVRSQTGSSAVELR